uniref:Uncharacterized protein n=1 Tax=Glycine max TaxID=3847 RepID=C6T905_SOYBN|nr:unknown [Glycine max]
MQAVVKKIKEKNIKCVKIRFSVILNALETYILFFFYKRNFYLLNALFVSNILPK